MYTFFFSLGVDIMFKNILINMNESEKKTIEMEMILIKNREYGKS